MELKKAMQQSVDIDQLDKLGKELNKEKLKARSQLSKRGWWPKAEYEKQRRSWAAMEEGQ